MTAVTSDLKDLLFSELCLRAMQEIAEQEHDAGGSAEHLYELALRMEDLGSAADVAFPLREALHDVLRDYTQAGNSWRKFDAGVCELRLLLLRTDRTEAEQHDLFLLLSQLFNAALS